MSRPVPILPWPLADEFQHQAQQADVMRLHVRDRAALREAAVREALERWVSELEPVLVYDHRGRFAGLTHAGQPLGGYVRVHVEAREGVTI